MDASQDLYDVAIRYATARHIRLIDPLGRGKDGTVFASDRAPAIKAFRQPEAFNRELACYQRLLEMSVDEVLGHHVPRLFDENPVLYVLEMTIVKPPFLLDFASAYLDWPPDFSAEVLQQWEEEKLEQFGANWPRVKVVLQVLEDRYGIYLFDVNPGNITFE